MSLGSKLRAGARSVTAPVRGYFNDHFEMVKQEVRATRSLPAGGDSRSWASVATLQNSFAEAEVHQARVIARLGDEVAELAERVGELEAVVRQLAAVVAAGRPDTADGEPAIGAAIAAAVEVEG